MRAAILAIWICAVLGATSAYVRKTCEHKTMHIDCGSRFIYVVRATYGRHSRSTCRSISAHNTNCHASSSLGVVKKACHGKHHCKVAASNSVFGDPCRGTYKYLMVMYSCKPFPLSIPLSSKVADTREICQMETSVISCPGKRIMVLAAFYSRRSKRICPQTANKGRCYKNVTSPIKGICYGKPECTLQANNSKYGTRCAGTYLIIKYKCV